MISKLMMIRSSGALFLSAVSPQAGGCAPARAELSPTRITATWCCSPWILLEEAPAIQSPKFVFAHIVSPHEPMVFGPNGETLEREPSYDKGYPDQIAYLNKRIIPMWTASCKIRQFPRSSSSRAITGAPERGRVRQIGDTERVLPARWRRAEAVQEHLPGKHFPGVVQHLLRAKLRAAGRYQLQIPVHRSAEHHRHSQYACGV